MMTREEMRLDAMNVQYVLTINKLHERISALKQALREIQEAKCKPDWWYAARAERVLDEEIEDID